MEKGVLTRAGVLLFGNNPFIIFPSSIINLTVYLGNDQTADSKTNRYRGTIHKQIIETVDTIYEEIDKWETITNESALAKTVFAYPIKCIREIVANSVVHRDYEDEGRKVHVRLFSDRLEVINPGRWYSVSLPQGKFVSLDTLITSGSVKRNSRLSEILSWTKLFEGEACGIPRAIKDCEEKDAPIPIVKEENGFVTVIIRPGKKIIIDSDIHVHSQSTKLPKILTTKNPTISPDKIIGRSGELENLHKRLFENRQVVLVNGLGGIGKTTIAQAYIGKYWDEYYHIAWISQTSEDIVNDVINTEGLMPNLNIQSQGKEPRQLFNEIINGLNRIQAGPNLLIIDNANADLCEWYDYLPRQPEWHILATSREKIEKFDVQELGFLSLDDAVQLFESHYTHGKISRGEIEELVTTVDLHTLTIEILAKTAQMQRTHINQLKEAIENDLKTNVYVHRKGDKIERVTSYLSSNFTMSKLTENEIWLLKQFTCLPPEFHDYELLKELIKPEQSEMDDSFSQTIEELYVKGWLLKNQNPDSFKMHRIIADVTKKQQNIHIADVLPLMESVTEKLSIDQTKDNPVHKFPWIPFGKTLLGIFPDCSDAKISHLQNNLALALKALGDYEGAKELLKRAMRSAEKNFGPHHPATAVSYSNLATVLKDLGDYEGAKGLLEKAMRSDEKNFGADHPSTARSYSNLALVLQDLGDYEGAKGLLEKAMRSDEKNFGADHPITAVRYSNLATVLKDLGDYEGAKGLLEKAMRSDEKNLGADHPTTAVSYSNLASVLQDLGDYEGAKGLLEKAMRSAEKNFGADHPTTAVRYSNLALVLQDLGDYEGAKGLLEKAMRSAEKNFGADHPTTAVSYSNLASVLQDLGDYEGAKGLLEKAMRSDEKNFGADHPTTAVRYSNLATVLKDLGDYEGAKGLLEKAMRSDEKNFGADHPTTAVSYSNLALVLQDLGDYEGAKGLLEKAMRSDEKNLGADHPTTAVSYSNLATVLKDLGDYKRALALSEKAVNILTGALPQGHPNIKIVSNIHESIKQQIQKEG
ncbi:MAG: tetratricopeptide repeat protein [Spirochaetota bacterium]|nr:tetratricopeptide repeat protein [Spirochaetota bacterium]